MHAPCGDHNVTFSLYPNWPLGFVFNVTHVWGANGRQDNGTWSFSKDDVAGQESDVRNNFGQAGAFFRGGLSMYPERALPSEMCEFC